MSQTKNLSYTFPFCWQLLEASAVDTFFFQLRMWSRPYKNQNKKKPSWSCACCANNYSGLLQFWPKSVWFSNLHVNVSKHFSGENMTEIIVITHSTRYGGCQKKNPRYIFSHCSNSPSKPTLSVMVGKQIPRLFSRNTLRTKPRSYSSVRGTG